MAVGKFGGGAVGVVSFVAGELVLQAGTGKGGLSEPQPIAFSSSVQTILTADFNGDGISDLAVASGSNVEILLGNATGFGSAVASTAGVSGISAMAAGDFDGDGKMDLVVMSGGTPGTLAFLKGDGNGTFATPVTIPAGVAPTSVVVADLNGDGIPDLAFADAGNGVTGAVYTVINKGGGAFAAPSSVFVASSCVSIKTSDSVASSLT